MKALELMVSAARGELRAIGKEPRSCNANDAMEVLDDLARKGIEAGKLFNALSDKQVKSFVKEWDKWRNGI